MELLILGVFTIAAIVALFYVFRNKKTQPNMGAGGNGNVSTNVDEEKIK